MSVTSYFKEVRAEMRHVSWPTRRMVIVYTAVVVGISLLTASYLGLLDYIFSAIIQKII
jgi:preprotein translocase subunit SecE